MADNRKCSAPSTSKQTESEEQNDYDVEKFVQSELKKAGINSERTSKDRFVCLTVVLK